MGFKVRLLEGKEARSFLKKRTKKLLYVVCAAGEVSDSGADVFCCFLKRAALFFRSGRGPAVELIMPTAIFAHTPMSSPCGISRGRWSLIVSAPADKPWGWREMAVATPEGHRMMFAQAI
jgi:hypothetical protein